jgi:hypothetical protein
MNYDYQHTPFSKALLTGLFCGLAATIASLAFSFIFKSATGYSLSTIVNVPIIIFFSLLVLTIAGLLFHVFTKLRSGKAIFSIFFLLLTAFVIWKISGVNRTTDPIVNVEFRELASGIMLITGICAFFLVPFLYHNRKFEDNVL